MQEEYNTLEQAFLSLKNEEELKLFIKDLCTPAEIRAIEERWLIAQMLKYGELSYRQISEKTGSSTTTIGRVARFMNEENNNGYNLALGRLKSCHKKD